MSDRWRVLVVGVGVGAALGDLSILADGVVDLRLFTIIGNLASPWGLSALAVGMLTRSPKRGALIGGLTLVVGVATYYALGSVRGYALGNRNAVWAVVALTFGPALGLCGALIASRRERPPTIAIAAPSVMLLAEAGWLVIDRRAWMWNLRAEPHRFADLAVVMVLVALAAMLPPFLVRDRSKLRVIYLVIALAGAIGAAAFALFYSLLVG